MDLLGIAPFAIAGLITLGVVVYVVRVRPRRARISRFPELQAKLAAAGFKRLDGNCWTLDRPQRRTVFFTLPEVSGDAPPPYLNLWVHERHRAVQFTELGGVRFRARAVGGRGVFGKSGWHLAEGAVPGMEAQGVVRDREGETWVEARPVDGAFTVIASLLRPVAAAALSLSDAELQIEVTSIENYRIEVYWVEAGFAAARLSDALGILDALDIALR